MEIAGQITAGLAAAHRHGVLHRGIKPANVLIDNRGSAKLRDFGLAVATDSANAVGVTGTPGYIAPELKGATYTVRSDFYSLGVVLLELFAGSPAVKMYQSDSNLIRKHLPDYSEATRRMICRCLADDPSDRPANAAEILARALDRFTREAALQPLHHLNQLGSYAVGFRSLTEPHLDSCGIFKDAVIGPIT